MEQEQLCHFEDMSHDIVRNILSRVQGKALASVACTCSDLNVLSQDQALWKHLCHSTWPSTSLERAELPVGFAEFYAKSYPLIVYDKAPTKLIPLETQASLPCDLLSFVDVYLNNNCVLSRIMNGIPQADDLFDHKDVNLDTANNERHRWFLGCPFRLDLFEQNYSEEANEDVANYNVGGIGNLPHEDLSTELTGNLRLSWILLVKRLGIAVNLSSWKPMSVQKSWPYDGNYVVQFGCIIPVEESVLPHKMARCAITTRFKIADNFEGTLQWREISLGIESIEGVQVNGEKSLKVLNQALICSSRSVNRVKVEEGLHQYEIEKNAIFKQKEFKEKLADRLYLLIELVIFVICFSCSIKLLF